MPTPGDTYREELMSMLDSFEFELCDICYRDADGHAFAPDMFGHPHAFCLDGEQS